MGTMASPPTGTVSLVFTDIQGSTALWEFFGKDFQSSLMQHNDLFRAAIAQFGGYEVKTEGDAFMVAFQDASAAVQMCLSMQRQLHAAAWPKSFDDPAVSHLSGQSSDELFHGLRVRMGVHTGTPECRPDPVTGRMDYFGRMVNRAARVGGAGHGGQILMSNATWEALGARFDGDAAVTELGRHSLRGMKRVETLRQILPNPLAERKFPPLKTLNQGKTNIHSVVDSFLGRSAELSELGGRIAQGHRLISLLGPGGIGKTRLAQRFGENQFGTFAGGVWFCDLTGARDLPGIVSAMSVSLRLPLTKGDPIKQISSALGEYGRSLIILDNFEQVVQFAPETIAQWLSLAPEAIFLVTSRTLLRIAGESVLYLEPLPRSEAVNLFFERGTAVFPQLERTEQSERTVSDIVVRLDCMTLAVELAAARVRMLSLEQILTRLSESLTLLGNGRRDHTSRQSSLRAAIDWSWQLLGPAERTVLAQMSVFRGGCTLDAVEAIVELSDIDDPPLLMDVVGALVDHSLLRRVEPIENHVRYQMLECIRLFAHEKLGDAFERTALAHAEFYGSLGAQELLESLDTNGGVKMRALLRIERQNLLVTVQEATVVSCPDIVAKSVLAVCVEYSMRGPIMDGVALLEKALSWTVSPEIQCQLLYRLGWFLHLAGNNDEALRQQERALELSQALGDKRSECNIVGNIAWLHREHGRSTQAKEHYLQAISIAREQGYRSLEGVNIGSLANLIRDQGNIELAREHYEEALGIAREIGDREAESITIGNLAWLHLDNGHFIAALEYFSQALRIAIEVGNRRGEGITLANIAGVQRAQTSLTEAMNNYTQALKIAREVGNRRGEGITLANIGDIQHKQGLYEASIQNLTAALSIAREVGDRKGESITLATFGAVQHDQGLHEAAVKSLTEALSISQQVGDSKNEGFVRTKLGMLYRNIGRFDEAKEQFELALEIVQATGSIPEQGKIIGNLGDLMMSNGDFEIAEKYLEQAISGCANAYPLESGIFGGSLALIRAHQGRFDEAHSLLDDGENQIRGVSKWELVKLLCKRFQVDCIKGDPNFSVWLDEAEAIAKELGASEASELGRMMAHAREVRPKRPPPQDS